jgi:hypothetical protein
VALSLASAGSGGVLSPDPGPSNLQRCRDRSEFHRLVVGETVDAARQLRKFWQFDVLRDSARQGLVDCIGRHGLVVVLNQVFPLPQTPTEVF